MIDADAIPDELQAVEQWICWGERERGDKQTKVPLAPETGSFASVTDADTWTDFETARATANEDSAIAGIGFVFTEQDSFVGVDLDDCRDPKTGRPESWAKQIITRLDSFTEVSPSGTGYHVYVRGELPRGGNRSGNVELYETARFFTVTGEHVTGTPTEIRGRSAALKHVHAEHIGHSVDSADATNNTTVTSIDDEELLSRAMNAKNGEKFSRLWRGDTSGYDSHSEADMALCFLLAFWTGGNASRMDRLFRRSGLHRPKWDDTHYSNGDTYGEGTISRAIAQTTEFYEPSTETDEVDESNNRPTADDQQNPSIDIEGLLDQIEHNLETVTLELEEARRQIDQYDHLGSQIESLLAQNEFLHEQLTREQRRGDELNERVTALEERTEEQSRHWLRELFG